MRRFLAGLAFVMCLGFAAEARAGDADAAAREETEARTPYALSFNPGAIVIGRFGGQFEYSLMPHHAVIVSLAYVSASSAGGDLPSPHLKGVATELGWRFYTGSSGPVGGFFGPSLLGGVYSMPLNDSGSDTKGFTILGGALDFGFQARVAGWMLFGAGVGVQTTQVSERFQDTWDARATFTTHPGILPRLILSLGGTFDVK